MTSAQLVLEQKVESAFSISSEALFISLSLGHYLAMADTCLTRPDKCGAYRWNHRLELEKGC